MAYPKSAAAVPLASAPLPVSVIVASTGRGGIGKDGSIPWRLKGDLAYFKRVTTNAPAGKKNIVIMGRKTWESIPAKFRPLPDRLNVVLTRRATEPEFSASFPEGVLLASSVVDALTQLATSSDISQ